MIATGFPDALFALSAINSGQQKSTRYQKGFGDSVLHDIGNYLSPSSTSDGGGEPVEPNSSEVKIGDTKIEKLSDEYQNLGKLSLELFAKHNEILEKEFIKHFKPVDDRQLSSLKSRALDCVRFFLLLGADTGLSFGTSARDWVRIIATLKASPLSYYRKIGWQI